MSFEAVSSLTLSDIPVNIQRCNNTNHINNKQPLLKSMTAKKVDERVKSNKEENAGDDSDDENVANGNSNGRHKREYHHSQTESQGSSTTETTSDGSDVVNLSNSKSPEKQSNTMTSEKQIALFIGDLPQNVTEEMLTNIFDKFKSFNSVKICLDSSTKKSLGYGYLNFGDQEDADKAVDEYNYMPVFGREIRIMPSLRNTYFRKNIGTNVFFSNLPLENSKLTTRIFYDEFKRFGKILSCKLDRRKNIGFIYFENDSSAKQAIKEYNGKSFFGTNIMCGIHFDRNVRKSPEFEQKIGRINNLTVVKETLETEEHEPSTNDSTGDSKLPHPNAIFVRNLPLKPNHDTLLNFFSKIGPVKSVYTSDVSKFDSSWAFITYKRIQDTRTAVETLNGSKLMKRVIEVRKAERHHLEDNDHPESNIKPNNYKKTVFLTNLSVICNEEFLNFFCGQERIKTERIIIRFYDEKSDTYSGYVKCLTRNDAQRLFDLMENKLLGDSEVKASWQQPKDFKVIEVETANPEKNNFVSKSGYVYRAPAPNYRTPRKQKVIRQDRKLTYSTAMNHSTVPESNNRESAPKKSYNYEAKKQLMNMLKKETKRCIDFLQHPVATRDENISTISSYIMDVYYKPNYDTLAQLLLLKPGNNYYERVFQNQVGQAIEKLGLQDR